MSSQIFYVNSEKALSGHGGDFSYQIPMASGNQYDRICVLQASIPLSFYLVSAGNNRFRLREPGHVSTVITVPEGNYNSSQFASLVGRLMTEASLIGAVYTIVLVQVTGKFRYQGVGAGVVGTVLEFEYTNLAEVMGAPEGGSITFGSDGTVLSPNVLNFVPTSSLFIHSNLTLEGGSILQEIYLNNFATFSFVTWICPSVEAYSRKLQSNQDRVFNFSVTDHMHRPVNFNGGNVLLTLLAYKSGTLRNNGFD